MCLLASVFLALVPAPGWCVEPPISARIQSPAFHLAADTESEEQQRTQYIQHALHPDVPLELQGLRQASAGTGFYVTRSNILSNHHVVANCKTVSSQLGGAGGRVTIAHILSQDPDHDLALLESTEMADQNAIFEADPERSDLSDLSIVGFAAHGLMSHAPKITAASMPKYEISYRPALVPFNADVHPGNSGSPLINQYGGVIGVVRAKIDTVKTFQKTGQVVTDRGFSINQEIVLNFLRRAGASYSAKKPKASLTSEERLATARHYLTLLGCWN